MIHIDIIAGFLGAGKTTFINELLANAYGDENIVIIENEFGEIGLDSEFVDKESGYIKEINAGCICCSLFGDFVVAIHQIATEIHPDRIIIEPTGLARTADVLQGCQDIIDQSLARINAIITMVDVGMMDEFLEVGGNLYLDQIRSARTIVATHTDQCNFREQQRKLNELNPSAVVIDMEDKNSSVLDILAVAESNTEEIDLRIPAKHHHHNHKNEGFCSVGVYPGHPLSQAALEALFEDIIKGCYGNIVRAKAIVTLEDQGRQKIDLTGSRWQMVPYTKEGEDRIVFIGSNLSNHLTDLFH